MQFKELFAADKGNWDNPQALFEHLDKVFHFDLDACAALDQWRQPSLNGAKCDEYYTAQDSLTKDWTLNNCAFLQPVDDARIGEFVRKAWRTARLSTPVVCLLPVRVEAAWFADYCVGADENGVDREIYFLKDRLKYGDGPLMVVIMRSSVLAEVRRSA